MSVRSTRRTRAGALVAALVAGLLVGGVPVAAYAEPEAPAESAPEAEAVPQAEAAEPSAPEADRVPSEASAEDAVPNEAPAVAPGGSAPPADQADGGTADDSGLAETGSPTVISGTVAVEPGLEGSVWGTLAQYPPSDSYCEGRASTDAVTGAYSLELTQIQKVLFDTGDETGWYFQGDGAPCAQAGEYHVAYSSYSSGTAAAPFGYAQSFWAGEGQPTTADRTRAAKIELAAGQSIDGIDIEPIKNGRITGTVTVDLDEIDPQFPGKPALIVASSRETGEQYGGSTPDVDGSFALDVPPGDYAVALYRWDAGGRLLGYYDGVYGDDLDETDLASATVVRVFAKQITPDIDFAAEDPEEEQVVPGTVTIAGTPEVGETLSASATGWQPADAEIAFHWNRNGVPVSGATGASYALTGADADAVISVTATGTKAGLAAATKTSASTERVVDRTPGSLTLTVTDEQGDPLAGAWVTVRSETTGTSYLTGTTDASGTFELAELPRAGYTVEAWGTAEFRGHETTTVRIEQPGQHVTAELRLVQPALPAGIAIDGASVGWGAISLSPSSEHRITVTDLTGASGTFTVLPGGRSFPLVEDPAGSGSYVGTIPANVAQADENGRIRITTELTWPGGATETQTFEVQYIDPSGHVVDQYGTPIAGAQVALSRSDSEGGAFAPVADGDTAVLSPSVNTRNPDTTDAEGFFRWDVAPGWYKVEASSAGKSVTTVALPVPPEQLNLLLAVPTGTVPAPSTAPAVSGETKLGSTLTVENGVWAAVAGERAPIETLGYQWFRDGVAITGATAKSYTVTEADQGAKLSVEVAVGRQLTPDTGTVIPWTITLAAGDVAAGGTSPAAKQLSKTGGADLTGIGLAGGALLLLLGAGASIVARRRNAERNPEQV